MTETLRLRKDRIVWREVDGEVVALDLDESHYLSVNRSGAVLWPALVRGTTREELARTLKDHFALDEAAAQLDVETFVADLATRELLDRE